MEFFGEELGKKELRAHAGDLSQAFFARRSVLCDGMGAGTEIIEVGAGNGLRFTVVPSRAFDIAWMEYCGRNISYISKGGMTSPQFYDPDGAEWLRGFYAGFLTTCGLLNVGDACEENGRKFRLHGRIANIPAEEVAVRTYFAGDDAMIELTGKMREAVLFGEDLVLKRRILAKAGALAFTITDTVENCGCAESPFMLMYHMNFGWPLIGGNSRVEFEAEEIEPINDASRDALADIHSMQEPRAQFDEQGFIVTPKTRDGRYAVCLKNDRLNFGVRLDYDAQALPKWMLWKLFRDQDNVVGVEPFCCDNCGYRAAKEKGTLRYLAPGETWTSEMRVSII